MAIRAYKDAKGRTRYAIEFQQAGQRILRRCPPGTRQAEAQEYETAIRREIFGAVNLGHKPEISLEEAILRWLRDTLHARKDQRKPRQNAELLAPFVVGKSLREVTEAARQATAKWTSAKHRSIAIPSGARSSRLSPATINRRLCVLKAAAKHAWKQGWIDENLNGRITLLPEYNKREVYLTAEQINTLASCSPSPPITAAIMIAAYSGLRASELLALPPISSRQDSLPVPSSKSKTSRPRFVPVVPLLRPYLSALPLGLSYSQLRKGFCKAREAAGMPHVRFHDLRHSCASMLINAGVDLYTVGAILGHSAPITTARYAHLAQGTLRRAMGKLR